MWCRLIQSFECAQPEFAVWQSFVRILIRLTGFTGFAESRKSLTEIKSCDGFSDGGIRRGCVCFLKIWDSFQRLSCKHFRSAQHQIPAGAVIRAHNLHAWEGSFGDFDRFSGIPKLCFATSNLVFDDWSSLCSELLGIERLKYAECIVVTLFQQKNVRCRPSLFRDLDASKDRQDQSIPVLRQQYLPRLGLCEIA